MSGRVSRSWKGRALGQRWRLFWVQETDAFASTQIQHSHPPLSQSHLQRSNTPWEKGAIQSSTGGENKALHSGATVSGGIWGHREVSATICVALVGPETAAIAAVINTSNYMPEAQMLMGLKETVQQRDVELRTVAEGREAARTRIRPLNM